MKVILGALAVSAILVSSALARDNDDNGNHYGWYKDDHGWHRHDCNRTDNHYGWYKDQGNPNDGGSSGRHYHAAPGPIAGAPQIGIIEAWIKVIYPNAPAATRAADGTL